jgi:hypothetical protein
MLLIRRHIAPDQGSAIVSGATQWVQQDTLAPGTALVSIPLRLMRTVATISIAKKCSRVLYVLALQSVTRTDCGMILMRKQLQVAIPVHAGPRAVQRDLPRFYAALCETNSVRARKQKNSRVSIRDSVFSQAKLWRTRPVGGDSG